MSQADLQHMRPNHGLGSVLGRSFDSLAVFERICVAEHYDYERPSLHELRLSLPGVWCQYDVSISWNTELEQIKLCLLFDGRAPSGRTNDICRLMSLINERLTVGHFDFWDSTRSLVYRNTVSLKGGARLSLDQAMDMLALSLDAAERGFPACQYVVWAGKTPEDALTTALVDLAALS